MIATLLITTQVTNCFLKPRPFFCLSETDESYLLITRFLTAYLYVSGYPSTDQPSPVSHWFAQHSTPVRSNPYSNSNSSPSPSPSAVQLHPHTYPIISPLPNASIPPYSPQLKETKKKCQKWGQGISAQRRKQKRNREVYSTPSTMPSALALVAAIPNQKYTEKKGGDGPSARQQKPPRPFWTTTTTKEKKFKRWGT